jgi:LPPG:FO 2-phospho-L-lactate transferase
MDARSTSTPRDIDEKPSAFWTARFPAPPTEGARAHFWYYGRLEPDPNMSHVTVLVGGIGGAKLLVGLLEVLPEEEIRAVVNVGDDRRAFGLHISPDIDTVLHALAGELDPARGWSRTAEAHHFQTTARKLGMRFDVPIDDRGLATHVLRTHLLAEGRSLEEATRILADRFGIGVAIIPATNDPVRTSVVTDGGDMSVREYYAGEAHASAVRYDGAEQSQSSATAIDAILTASRVILAPADPVRGMSALLALPGIRKALADTRAPVIGVSPLAGSQPVDAARNGTFQPRLEGLMTAAGFEAASVPALVTRFRPFMGQFVMHTTDLGLLDGLRETGIGVWVENIVMGGSEDAARLARRLVNEERRVG